MGKGGEDAEMVGSVVMAIVSSFQLLFASPALLLVLIVGQISWVFYFFM
jgi:hypothetical protein